MASGRNLCVAAGLVSRIRRMAANGFGCGKTIGMTVIGTDSVTGNAVLPSPYRQDRCEQRNDPIGGSVGIVIPFITNRSADCTKVSGGDKKVV